MNALTTLWKKYPHWVLLVALLLLLAVLAVVLRSSIHIVDQVESLPRHPSKRFPKRDLSSIQRIAVHHSAVEGQTAQDYARYHVLSRQWPGIGYHFVLEIDGTIVQTNALERISYHVANGNTPTIGICLSGDFRRRDPSPQQLKSLGKLIRYLRRLLGRPLLVYPHHALQQKPTSCPGHHLEVLLAPYNQGIAA